MRELLQDTLNHLYMAFLVGSQGFEGGCERVW
jgi:hypothetical protein